MYTPIRYQSSNRRVAAGLLACWLALVACPQSTAQKPWALRDHYAIQNGATTFSYDVSTSEWQIKVDGHGPALNNVSSEVLFADGRRIRVSDLEMLSDERDDVNDHLGAGTYFRTVYKPADGVSVRYSIRRFKTRPFVMLFMEVRNESTAPLRLSSIRPAVFDNQAVTNAARAARKTVLDARQRGGMPAIAAESGAATYIGFEFSGSNAAVGLGVLPSGATDTRIAIDSANEGIPIYAGAAYDPPITLQPGESVRGDPIWIGFMDNGYRTIESFYSWSRSVLPTTRRVTKLPTAWVTADESQTADELYGVARAWRREGIANVLVPAYWEIEPGSLRSRTALYPSDMSLVASTLQGIGVTAGIAHDPLGAAGARDKYVYTTAEGQRWFIPTDQESFRAAVNHVQPLVAWGFKFFVVESSRIPDEALDRAGITRLEADMAAVRIMMEAAKNFPVLPSPSSTLAGELDRWRQVAATSRSMPDHSLVAGPVRLITRNLDSVSDELKIALSGLAGPVEIVGAPGPKIRRPLADALAAPAWHARLPRPGSPRTDREYRTR